MDGGWRGLGEVKVGEPSSAGGAAGGAGGELIQIPEVGEDAASAEGEGLVDGGFEGAEIGRLEKSGMGEGVEGAVATADRDEGDRSGTAIEGELGGLDGPMDGIGGGLEGGLDEDEGAEGDALVLEMSGGAGEGVGGDPFIETGEDLGMDGFEAEGDFEGDGGGGGDVVQEVAEVPATIADEGRVGFDDDAGDMAEALGDGGMISGRDGVGIEEAAGVIEFDPGPGGIGGVGGGEPG
jgi:hypothetical protein